MRHNAMLAFAAALLLLNSLNSPCILEGCHVTRLATGEEICRGATYVVRATSLRYVHNPGWGAWTTGVPDCRVVFRVEEVLKGTGLPRRLAIRGYLSDYDDFNDHPAPYLYVRPGGRRGSCYANSYKRGAQFLLFLQKRGDEYSPYWRAAASVNKQLHGKTDPWLTWVKGYLRGHSSVRTSGQK
jgi:hypothetical protein